MVHQKITVIINPISGQRKDKQRLKEFVFNYFSRNGNQCVLKESSHRGEATDFARQCVEQKDNLVIVLGGDGTINEVITGLVGSDVALGIVPTGSGNGLARTLDIPLSIEKACRVIANGREVKIDTGKANNRFFALVAGVGFDANVGKRFDEYSKRGAASYFYVGAKEFFFYKPQQVKLSFDDKALELVPFIVAIANGRQYGNNAIIAPEAKLNDGFFNITIVHNVNFFRLISALPKLFSGKFDRYPDADFYKAKKIRIERNAPALINIDGEAVLEEPVVEVSILPQSLKIIAPPNSACLH